MSAPSLFWQMEFFPPLWLPTFHPLLLHTVTDYIHRALFHHGFVILSLLLVSADYGLCEWCEYAFVVHWSAQHTPHAGPNIVWLWALSVWGIESHDSQSGICGSFHLNHHQCISGYYYFALRSPWCPTKVCIILLNQPFKHKMCILENNAHMLVPNIEPYVGRAWYY